MSYEYSEDKLIEDATEEVLKDLGWEVVTAWHNEKELGPDSLLGRENKAEVILVRDLRHALTKLNPGLPEIAYKKAIETLTQRVTDKTLGAINQEKYKLLKEGIPVSFTNSDGELAELKLKVFDYNEYANNKFLAVRQFEVVGDLYNRRPDVVGFVNGIPLLFIELKSDSLDLRHAYDDNLTDYKDTIPHLFYCNGFIILSNGVDAKVGTITSPYKYFLDWKRLKEEDAGEVSLQRMLRGTCHPQRLMDIFENFLLFDTSFGEVVKIMAKNHQYIGVNDVIKEVHHIDDLEGKLGVFWHTQGSGKSYSMVFLCEKIHRKLGGSYTFLLVVDRSELESQLYDTFSGVGVVNDKGLIAGNKSGMTGREHLRELLSENHRYVFTLIHKFSIDPNKETEYPLITNRKNIIVISDEAHRTQGGTYARNMRFHALPNASYLGFTGTPIIKEEEEITKDIFGDYVSIYDFKRAVDDGATLPLRYINRGELLDITNPELDEQMAAALEDENLTEEQRQKLVYKFNRNYPILTAESRLRAIAKDLVWHFNERGYQGKAMLVTLDKPTAVRMYDYIQEYWQDYLKELKQSIEQASDEQEELELKRKYQRVEDTEVCVVVSDEQNEVKKFRALGLEIEPHRKKMKERDLEKEFKDPENPFRLAIVCAMWITGFDAQSVSTVYLDKPIKGHTLMQTIARANRVYDDEKENGLIVDYGNVYQQLEKAYSVYGESGSTQGGNGTGGHTTGGGNPVPELLDLVKELKEAMTEIKGYLNSLGFDLDTLTSAKTALERLNKLGQAENSISLNETTRATFQVMATNVFKKYKALFPEPVVKPFTKDFNAIEAIYKRLNQKVKSADITVAMKKLQEVVSDSIAVRESQEVYEVQIDLSNLDFDNLKRAFAKSDQKNTVTYTLKQAVEKKLNQMLRENPLRVEFYERYQEIIDEYNKGKSLENTVKVFDELNDFIKDLSKEEKRAMKENLGDQEVLAIFDLLTEGKELGDKERKEVKKVAKQTLDKLKAEKLKVERWRESQEVTSQIKVIIKDNLLYLPMEAYSDEEVDAKAQDVYQHIFASYRGGNDSVYGMRA